MQNQFFGKLSSGVFYWFINSVQLTGDQFIQRNDCLIAEYQRRQRWVIFWMSESPSLQILQQKRPHPLTLNHEVVIITLLALKVNNSYRKAQAFFSHIFLLYLHYPSSLGTFCSQGLILFARKCFISSY